MYITHGVVSYVVFLFLRALMRGNPTVLPFFAALVFLVHPVQTEAVSYITQRMTSLAALWYLLACYIYVQGRRHRSFPLMLCVVLPAALGFFTKENTLTLPVILFLLEYYFLSSRSMQLWKKVVVFSLMFLFGAVAVILYTIKPHSSLSVYNAPVIVLSDQPAITPEAYLFTQIHVMVSYLRLLFFPVSQNLDYDYPLSGTLLDVWTLAKLSVIAFLLFVSIVMRKRDRCISFGIAFFFVALAVESSVIPLADVIFEHRLYLPMVGFVLAVSSAAHALYSWVAARFGKPAYRVFFRACSAGVAITIIVSLSFATVRRNAVWSDAILLWSDTVSKSPGKPRPRFVLAVSYLESGNTSLAIEEMKQAIDLNLSYIPSPAHPFWTYLSGEKGLFAEALYGYAREKYPDNEAVGAVRNLTIISGN